MSPRCVLITIHDNFHTSRAKHSQTQGGSMRGLWCGQGSFIIKRSVRQKWTIFHQLSVFWPWSDTADISKNSPLQSTRQCVLQWKWLLPRMASVLPSAGWLRHLAAIVWGRTLVDLSKLSTPLCLSVAGVYNCRCLLGLAPERYKVCWSF